MDKILVFGATSKLAEETVRHIKGVGTKVMLVAQNQSKLDVIYKELKTWNPEVEYFTYILDALDFVNHQTMFDEAINKLGGLDTFFVAHGTLPDNEKIRKDATHTVKEFNINCLSVISLCTICSNYFENQRKGTIAVISSVAGERGRQSNYIYGAAKAGVSAYLQGLRNRMFEFGVTVITIKPGMVKTPMTLGMPDSPLFAKPEKVGKDIFNAIKNKKDIIFTPSYWKIIMTIIKLIPESIFKKLKL
jgi:short-subunit dehydrogenase